jgi:hypothetical protein
MTTYDPDYAAYRWIVGNLRRHPDPLPLFPFSMVMRYDGEIMYYRESGKEGVTKFRIASFTNLEEFDAHDPESAIPAIKAARAMVR